MLNLTKEEREKFLHHTTSVEVTARVTDGENKITVYTEENILMDSLEITSSICDSQEFMFGGCISSKCVLQLINVPNHNWTDNKIEIIFVFSYLDQLYPHKGLYPSKTLYPKQGKTVSKTFHMFTGTIDSAKRLSNNRNVVEIIAYDYMYKLSNISIYNYAEGVARYSPTALVLSDVREYITDTVLKGRFEILSGSFTGFNDSKHLEFNLDNVESIFNDKTSCADMLSAYCELNCCFAYFDNIGVLRFKMLPTYMDNSCETVEEHSTLTFEDFVTADINKLKLRYNKNDYAEINSGNDKESWYVSDNIITSCFKEKSYITSMLNGFRNNLDHFEYLTNTAMFGNQISYRPYEIELFSYWWLTPGDKVTIQTGFDNDWDIKEFDSYVFSKSIKGINGFKTTISAQGVEKLGKDEVTYNV